MIILIDIGNTRIKWAAIENSQLNVGSAFHYDVQNINARMTDVFGALTIPERIVVANVGGSEIAQHLSEWIQKHWQKKPEFINSQSSVRGVENGYDNFSALGVDRWLGMIAAKHEFKTPLGIIHCGTCITIDALDQKGRHRGGFIAPGLSLLQSSVIARATGCAHAALNAHPSSIEWARETDAGIQRGSVLMVIAFIEKMRSKLMTEFGKELTLVISGGDVEYLLPLLTGEYQHRPHLVLQGLAEVIHHRP